MSSRIMGSPTSFNWIKNEFSSFAVSSVARHGGFVHVGHRRRSVRRAFRWWRHRSGPRRPFGSPRSRPRIPKEKPERRNRQTMGKWSVYPRRFCNVHSLSSKIELFTIQLLTSKLIDHNNWRQIFLRNIIFSLPEITHVQEITTI